MWPQYLVLATNVVLSPDLGRGGIDRVDDLITWYVEQGLPLHGWAVWHHDQICRLLDVHDGVRRTYGGLTTVGDALAEMQRVLARLAPPEIPRRELLTGQTAEDRMAQPEVRLDQAGQPTKLKAQLSDDAADLPGAFRPAEGSLDLEQVPPLRGLGPKVFISCSFSDLEPASRIATYLTQCGMQVQLEDQTSLLGQRIDDVLRERISSAEIFLQLITETSAQSARAAKEFRWATEAGCVVLPVVVDNAVAPEPVADWASLPVSSAIDGSALDVIRDVALRSIVTLPLDPDRPYQLAEPELHRYDPDSGRRVLLDSNGLILRMIRATIEFCDQRLPAYREQMVAQQIKEYNRCRQHLAVLDAFLPGFLQHLRRVAENFWRPEDVSTEIIRIVQRFVRLTLGPTVIDLAAHWSIAIDGQVPPATMENCRSAVAAAESLKDLRPGWQDGEKTFWALDASPGQRWLYLGFDGKDQVDGTQLVLPADHFDQSLIRSSAFTGEPTVEVSPVDWRTIGLPQVAARVVPADVGEVPDVLDRIGWSLSQYRIFGPA